MAFPVPEVAISIIGVLISVAFGGWAAVIKRSADRMEHAIENAVKELSQLREEIHRDRLVNERRFSRLESIAGLRDRIDSD